MYLIIRLIAILLEGIDISLFTIVKYNSVVNFVIESILYFLGLKFINLLKILCYV